MFGSTLTKFACGLARSTTTAAARTRTQALLSNNNHFMLSQSKRGVASLACLPEEQQMLKDSCRSFADNVLFPAAGEIDKNHRYPDEIIKQLGEMGLMSIYFDEEFGGTGMDSLAYAIAMEVGDGTNITTIKQNEHANITKQTQQNKGN